MAKIAVADVFVADVSIINAGAPRPTPNPNVLVELGYAVAQLGWDNIILVQNSAFGGPELLPFDLRGRRTVVYDASDGSDRAKVKALLQGRLEAGLRAAMEAGPASNLASGREANLWWGEWHFDAASAGGTLFIRDVGPCGFLFDLEVSHGAHSGFITAYGRIVSRDIAYCRLSNGETEPEGELIFRRRIDNGRRIIEVEEASPCIYFRGARASFGGNFVRDREPWFDRGFMNELEIARLHRMLGKNLEKMRNCTSDVSERDNLDEEVMARVVSGGVAGLYTIMESIVMFNGNGEMWAAYIDDAMVRYFTNVPAYRNVLPKTIDDWRSGFADMPVDYCEPEMALPKLNG
ncbi:hypothetical protein CQ10_13835 [Bradyrhizobium valentinum]|uniref:Uncharacterized protein n=1 Tax=Bradyrhizobium valentinum TaxID=1518501 RepID=A0A0R3LED8_9BRAD|nr:hypothetical protein CP49_03670 [Bradyrhizobium valentinum]KRR08658.1 hypothetical protein CQ10_13835 [Bradyrhizobium valentinum]